MSIQEVWRLRKWVPRCITYFLMEVIEQLTRVLKGGRTHFESHFEGIQSTAVRQAEEQVAPG